MILLKVGAVLTAATAAAGLLLTTPAAAGPRPPEPTLTGAGPVKTVAFGSYRIAVPRSWPVIHLSHASAACVRFDVHAVYLGHPGTDQACPAHLVGRTEAVLIEPFDAVGRTHVDPSLPGAGAAVGVRSSMEQRIIPSSGLLVTASFGTDPRTVLRMLNGAVTATGASAAGRTPTRADLAPASPSALAKPFARGSVPGRSEPPARPSGSEGREDMLPSVSGLGFDTCAAPSLDALHAWDASPYRSVGVYIGGTNRACALGNLTPSWVSGATSIGWSLLPVYVGLQAPCVGQSDLAEISGPSAVSEGLDAAMDAVRSARSLDMGAGTVVYYDMEGYSAGAACRAAVLTLLSAWTSGLHGYGYRSGVYSSADSGIADLVSAAETPGMAEPDAVWIARWNDDAVVGSDPAAPSRLWAVHQRVHQYTGASTDTFDRVTLSVDHDAVDGPVASVGDASSF